MILLNRKCFLTDMMCSYMRYALTDILLSPAYSEDLQEAAMAFIRADLSDPSSYEKLRQRFLA